MKTNKVCDYDIDWSSGCFTCCADHVMNNNDFAKVGDIIECEECKIEMILSNKNGKIMWRRIK